VKSIALAFVTIAALGAGALAQDTPQPAQPQQAAQARTPQPAQAPQERQPAEERERTMPPPPPPAPPAPQERRPLPTRNVRIDVTITDQTGTATAMKKVVSMVVADGRSSGVRSNTSVPLVTGGPNRDLPLNVDAYANITPEQKVLLELKFNYSSVNFITPVGTKDRPAPTSDVERDLSSPRAAIANITEELRVLLLPNTPTIVARSADAAADRTVTVEVKAEILK
jgi:hypothetical protein